MDDVATSDLSCCQPVTSEVMGESEAQQLALVFSALADPVRLRMLTIIASTDAVCSCHLEGPLARSQPTISHHTRVLAGAGLIVAEKRGRWTWWRVAPERLETVARLLRP